jgi:hypothetical protein
LPNNYWYWASVIAASRPDVDVVDAAAVVFIQWTINNFDDL